MTKNQIIDEEIKQAIKELTNMLEELNLSEIQIENDKVGKVKVARNNYKPQIPNVSTNQEKTNNADVKEFCEVNFNINFPLSTITEVKGENAHEIFKWAKANYGKSAVPKWNFYKILINKDGKIEDTFASFTKPMSKKLIKIIEKIL